MFEQPRAKKLGQYGVDPTVNPSLTPIHSWKNVSKTSDTALHAMDDSTSQNRFIFSFLYTENYIFMLQGNCSNNFMQIKQLIEEIFVLH